ncbi:hypothetical protein [Leptospira levettii]|uniref:hypothetical protein n=1 Tax=Leptospira levettii TaxID=2023178 RepID=UPI0014384D3F|nr:hypothetical protein [Leptospira levettii]
MAATSIEKIPSLKGEKAKEFVKKAESTESRKVEVYEQQKNIYLAFTLKNLKK